MSDTAPRTDRVAARFLYGIGEAATWQDALAAVLVQLGQVGPEHRLGFIYLTEHFGKHLADIEVFLRQTTGVPHWVGSVGYGVCAGRKEVFGSPAAAVLLAPLPEDAFRVFHSDGVALSPTVSENSAWIEQAMMPLILTHADAASGDLPDRLRAFAADTGGYLFGGLTASPGEAVQVADGVAGGISGVMISPHHTAMQTGLSQGCSPIGPTRRVTACEGHVIVAVDDRPALEALKEDIGPELAADLPRIAGRIFAALPVPGSDTGDYLVRNLIGIDPNNDLIAIGDTVEPGDMLLFCERDRRSAVEDMERMLRNLKRRTGGAAVRGGLYISCAARGPNQFDRRNTEMDLIERHLGAFPLIGFFANGEISGDRLYGYTGVLALFL